MIGDGNGNGNGDGSSDGNGGRRVRVRKLRLLFIFVPLAALAIVSTLFGMMMAVASELPSLETSSEFASSEKSELFDVRGNKIGVLTNEHNRILVPANKIAPTMQRAIIAIEDERFYENDGVDLEAIGRALWQDLSQQDAVQGGSTITQQFVKNALQAQDSRTILAKMREAALAYHLTKKWSKSKILTEYLNAIYFGNGAYGIESAARTYFSWAHPGCEDDDANPCASQLEPHEAALIAGVVASPARWDPVTNPKDSKDRRDTVLDRMYEQGYLTKSEWERELRIPVPTAKQVNPPTDRSAAPYFTSWVRQQAVDRWGAQKAFGGGLKIRTSLDLEYQRAAEQAVKSTMKNAGPTAALVMVDNASGGVRAMVGGPDIARQPFNLATQGQRQPGSAFKPFVLAAALKDGVDPLSTWESKQKIFDVPNSVGEEKFVVNNFEGDYAGVRTLADATTQSDNSVYAEVGIKIGIPKIVAMAKAMGIRTPISDNYAITLGGLEQGVTPLDMAHAFETIEQGGERVSGSLSSTPGGPVGLLDVRGADDDMIAENEERRTRVLAPELAEAEQQILQTVVTGGTATAANIGGFVAGKTGTTENSADAWFVGFTKRHTVAVWVGYPDSLKPMETEYNGGPVKGGTFPAEIFGALMTKIAEIDQKRNPQAPPPPDTVLEQPLPEAPPVEAAPVEEIPVEPPPVEEVPVQPALPEDQVPVEPPPVEQAPIEPPPPPVDEGLGYDPSAEGGGAVPLE